MSEIIDNPFVALTFIAGPAVLTNACATLQNGATIRYGSAITQWREFRASIAGGGDMLSGQYADVDAAIRLAQLRIRLLLRGLDFLYAAVAFFAFGALVGLIGAILAAGGRQVISVWAVIGVGAVGLTLLLCALVSFTSESRCTRSLLRLQLIRDDMAATG
jgi:hypothetical protein